MNFLNFIFAFLCFFPVLSLAASAKTSIPKLVVIVVVDQMRFDYLERFKNVFSSEGFIKVSQNGALFANANYAKVPTFTASGHADILTGATPSQHGIIANYWYDKKLKRMIDVVEDDRYQVVDSGHHANDPLSQVPKVGSSPKRLIGTTFGDELQMSNGFQSKVISISLKDRSAVIAGGQSPTGAYWFDNSLGEIVTSSYYQKNLPGWVKKFNLSNNLSRVKNQKWDLLFPENFYKQAQKTNLSEQKSPLGYGFPHILDGKSNVELAFQFVHSPFANSYLVEFADAAIRNEKLGQRNVTDLLTISFSAPDAVGHSYGPDSREIMDIYARLDKDLAQLLKILEKDFSKDFLICLTSDHGVSPVPEYLNLHKIPGRRIDSKEFEKKIDNAVEKKFGIRGVVEGVANDQVYLDREKIESKKLPPADIESFVGKVGLTFGGVLDYWTATQMKFGTLPKTEEAKRIQNGYFSGRSGDVYFKLEPFTFFADASAATHGSGFTYDLHVPVIFYGKGIRSKVSFQKISPSDIAPTLAALVHINAPANATGQVIRELVEK